jgi:hypothetical protein
MQGDLVGHGKKLSGLRPDVPAATHRARWRFPQAWHGYWYWGRAAALAVRAVAVALAPASYLRYGRHYAPLGPFKARVLRQKP